MSIIIKRIIPYLVPLLAFVGLELTFAKPASGWIFLSLIFTVGLAGFIFIVKGKLNKKTAQLLLPGVLFLFIFNLFFLFLAMASPIFKHIFALIAVVFLGIALEIIFKLFHNQRKVRAYFDFFSYLNLLTIFMVFSSLGSAGIFLGINNWILIIMAIPLSLAVFYSDYYIVNYSKKENGYNIADVLGQKVENLINQSKIQKILYIFVPVFVLVEIFWALSFLPTEFYINGFILTVYYYIIFGLVKNRLNNNLNKSIVKRYVVIGGLCLLLIIFTARV